MLINQLRTRIRLGITLVRAFVMANGKWNMPVPILIVAYLSGLILALALSVYMGTLIVVAIIQKGSSGEGFTRSFH